MLQAPAAVHDEDLSVQRLLLHIQVMIPGHLQNRQKTDDHIPAAPPIRHQFCEIPPGNGPPGVGRQEKLPDVTHPVFLGLPVPAQHGVVPPDPFQPPFPVEELAEGPCKLLDVQAEILLRVVPERRNIFLRLREDIFHDVLRFGKFPGGGPALPVFHQPAHQITPGIFFHHIPAGVLHPRQHHFRLDPEQLRRQHHELRSDVHIQFPHGLNVFQILAGDFGNPDVVDAHPGIFDQVHQQIEGPLENREPDFIAHLP